MTFSQSKKTLLKPQKEMKLFTFLVALFTAACLFVPYMIQGEGYFTFYGDFNVQQIPFYQMCHQSIKDGNISWSWLTDLGSDFIGAYAFYLLGSPFFWLTLLFPNSFVPYLMGPLLILKFACAAFTAYLYICRFTKTAYAASLGGLLYAFSGFSIYNIFFNHFHEALVVFPLLLLSIELLITENRRGVFALCVALCAVTNYFFFFGMVVFCVIYFFMRLISKAIKIKFSHFLIFVFEAVLGLALSAILLLPALNVVMGNERVSEIYFGWNSITYGKEHIYLNVIQCFFFPPDLPARPVFFPEADVEWSSLGGWLPLFGMTGFFAWFKLREKSWLKRVLVICVVCALVPVLNSAFYAFNDAYYARWFYMPVLMICLATAMLTEDKSVDFKKGLVPASIITLIFTFVVGFFPQTNYVDDVRTTSFGLYTQDDDALYVARFWVTAAIAVVCIPLQMLLFKILKNKAKRFYKCAIAGVCAVSILYGNIFIALGRTHSYDIKNVVIDGLIEEEIDLNDDSNFRIDVYDGADNTGMYLGLSSINTFHSVVSPSIMEFYEYIGVERSVASRPETSYPSIRSLLSVKYLLNLVSGYNFTDENGETLMVDYEYIETQGKYRIYENKNYVPYGFSYDYYMNQEFCDGYSGENRARCMLKAILLSDEQIKKYGKYMTNVEELTYAPYNNEVVTLDFSYDTISVDADALRKTSAHSFEVDNDGFTAKVTRDKKSLVFFSVPYDEGWSATVNGKPVEVEKVNVGFMAVLVDAGESEIRFDYQNKGLPLGIAITAGAMVILIIYVLISVAYNKKHPSEICYPEGEQLMEAWILDDVLETVEELDETNLEIQSQNVCDCDTTKSDLQNTQSTEFHGGFKIDQSILDDNEGNGNET